MAENPSLPSGHTLRTAAGIVERGCVREVGALLDRRGARRLLIVRDQTAWRTIDGELRFGAAVAERFARAYDVVTSQPTSSAIDRVAREIAAAEIDTVLAVGGGTALDIAKAATVTAASGRAEVTSLLAEPDLGAFEGVAQRSALVAVPTTAGTGAEATSTAVVYVDGVKHSLEGDAVRPACALVDAALCDRLPASVTATTGLDCLCQAAESLWAVGSDEHSRAHALRALQLAVAHIERAVTAPDREARDAMSLAAHLAGLAIDSSRTTAPHALSYVLSARHGVAHGHAVALFFGELLEMLGRVCGHDCGDARGVEFVSARIEQIVNAFGATTAHAARERFDHLLAACGLATRLVDVGVGTQDLEQLVNGINARRLANHPQRLGPVEIRGLVQRLHAR